MFCPHAALIRWDPPQQADSGAQTWTAHQDWYRAVPVWHSVTTIHHHFWIFFVFFSEFLLSKLHSSSCCKFMALSKDFRSYTNAKKHCVTVKPQNVTVKSLGNDSTRNTITSTYHILIPLEILSVVSEKRFNWGQEIPLLPSAIAE